MEKKIYLMIAFPYIPQTAEEWPNAVRGVFSTLENAQAFYPGEWVESEDGAKSWGMKIEGKPIPAYILEYDVDPIGVPEQ